MNCFFNVDMVRFQFDLFDNMAAAYTQLAERMCVSIRQTHGTNDLDIIDDREQVAAAESKRERKIEKSLALDFQFNSIE